MTPCDYRQFYRRKLPHIHSPGATIFTTFRLVGSIPAKVIHRYRAARLALERRVETCPIQSNADFYRHWFVELDAILDKAGSGPTWLATPAIRDKVREKLLEGDGSKYRLDAFCIMCNHVHVVFRPMLDDRSLGEKRVGHRLILESEEDTLAKIMQSWKGGSARACNQILNRSGQFWDHESFDREVRGYKGFVRAIRYTLRNAVKAGLKQHPLDWPGNFVAERLMKEPWLEDLVF